VILESITFEHHYADAHHSKWVGLTKSTYPDNEVS